MCFWQSFHKLKYGSATTSGSDIVSLLAATDLFSHCDDTDSLIFFINAAIESWKEDVLLVENAAVLLRNETGFTSLSLLLANQFERSFADGDILFVVVKLKIASLSRFVYRLHAAKQSELYYMH